MNASRGAVPCHRLLAVSVPKSAYRRQSVHLHAFSTLYERSNERDDGTTEVHSAVRLVRSLPPHHSARTMHPGVMVRTGYGARPQLFIRGFATESGAAAPSSDSEPKQLKTRKERWADTWKHVKLEVKHYYLGFKLLVVEVKTASATAGRALEGKTLSRREYKQLVSAGTDTFRLFPTLVLFIIPFGELALPFLIKAFPNFLPSTFTKQLDKEAAKKKKLRARIAMADYLYDTMEEIATSAKAESMTEAGDAVTAKDVVNFIEKARNGKRIRSDDILRMAPVFQDEITIDSAGRSLLVTLSKLLGLNTTGSDAFLRYQLRRRIRTIKADDKDIIYEGVENLTQAELEEACRDRGMPDFNHDIEALRLNYQQWLDLSMNKKIPTTLLIMSRAFTYHQMVPAKEKEEPQEAAAWESEEAAEASRAKRSKEDKKQAKKAENKMVSEVVQAMRTIDDEVAVEVAAKAAKTSVELQEEIEEEEKKEDKAAEETEQLKNILVNPYNVFFTAEVSAGDAQQWEALEGGGDGLSKEEQAERDALEKAEEKAAELAAIEERNMELELKIQQAENERELIEEEREEKDKEAAAEVEKKAEAKRRKEGAEAKAQLYLVFFTQPDVRALAAEAAASAAAAAAAAGGGSGGAVAPLATAGAEASLSAPEDTAAAVAEEAGEGAAEEEEEEDDEEDEKAKPEDELDRAISLEELETLEAMLLPTAVASERRELEETKKDLDEFTQERKEYKAKETKKVQDEAARAESDGKDGAKEEKAKAAAKKKKKKKKKTGRTTKAVSNMELKLVKMLKQIEEDIDKEDASMGETMHLLDADNDGVISREELSNVLRENVSIEHSEEEILSIVEKMDLDNDGNISVQEFLQYVKARREDAAEK
jgi:hypothetical protein